MKQLDGKTILVVGATGGIGGAICRELATRGAIVIGIARTMDKLRALQSSVGENMKIASADSSNPSEFENLLRVFSEAHKQIDAVVLAAGTWGRLDPKATTEDALKSFREMFDKNFLPNIVPAHVAYRALQKQERGGVIFHISSHAAIRDDLHGNLSYSPFKAAATMYIRNMQKFADKKVRFCDIRPAIVNTPDASVLLDTPEKKKAAVQAEDIAIWIAENIENPPPEIDFKADIEI